MIARIVILLFLALPLYGQQGMLLVGGDRETYELSASSENISAVTLSTFCASTDCRVRTWYDQTGHSRNAVNANFSRQPEIYSAGVIFTLNGKTSFYFDVTSGYLVSAFGTTFSQPNTIVAVYKYTQDVYASSSNYYLFGGTTSATRNAFFMQAAVDEYQMFAGSSSADINNSANQEVLMALFNSTNSEAHINNVSTTSLSVGTQPSNGITIGGAYTTGFNLKGEIQEIIIYTDDRTGSRTAIQTNINNYYSIY